ncbi:MAG: FAD-dependent oxidoreductase [Deltaproteobacteria bacterium]|nr:FAD-dependent oxidoreductase [Deltaproteobacteria bacterium]
MPRKKRIVVIGGSAAGPKAAAKAKRINYTAEVVMFQRDPDLSMASCGYPYYVGGYFDDRNMLIGTTTGAVRNKQYFLDSKGVDARTNTEVTAIERIQKRVSYRNLITGETGELEYEKLIIATGATPRMPPVPGTGLEGITTLQSMRDADYLRKVRDDKRIKEAVVIGGGLIGIETCEALQRAGIEITVVELLPQLMTFLDWEMAKLVENYVKTQSANVITGNGIAEFLGKKGKLTGIKLRNGTELPCELAVVAIGVEPNVKLAREAGLTIGKTGGIEVDEFMQTSDPNIYAAGDCIETYNMISGTKVLAPLGDLANLQGRVAGENAATENIIKFPGTIQTGICKIFEYNAGSTGLSEARAGQLGYEDIMTCISVSLDKPGFMGGLLLITKIVADRKNGRILGAQCIGPGNVNRQIAQWAMAIMSGHKIEDLINCDLPYAPPFSLAIDHFVAGVHVMQNKMKGRMDGISTTEVKAKLDRGEHPFIVDVRASDEYKEERLGIGEVLIPNTTLRENLNKLPDDKTSAIICYCVTSLRAYESALVMRAEGWKNVRVMEGGIMAWPYEREK